MGLHLDVDQDVYGLTAESPNTDQFIDCPVVGFGFWKELSKLLLEPDGRPGPVDVGMYLWEEELEELTQVEVESVLPRFVVPISAD